MHHVIGFQIIEFIHTFAKFLHFYTRGLSYSLIILACFNIQMEVVQLGVVQCNPQWHPPSLNDLSKWW